MILRNRYRLKSITIDGSVLTIKTFLDCRRGPGVVRIGGRTVTPTGANYGTVFTYTVSPSADVHENLTAILGQNAVAQNSLRYFVIQNITAPSSLQIFTKAMSDTLVFTDEMVGITPIPGTVVLSGQWTDQSGIRPQWAEYGAPVFSETLPEGWTRYLFYRWSLDSITWMDSSFLDTAVADFCFDGYNESDPIAVQYAVVTAAPDSAETIGPWTDSAGNIGGYDTVSVVANVPTIVNDGSYANLTIAVASWYVVQEPVEMMDLDFSINDVSVASGTAPSSPISIVAPTYTPSIGDTVKILAAASRNISNYTGGSSSVYGYLTTLVETNFGVGTVVLSGNWVDYLGTRPQWNSNYAPSFSEDLPDGWTRDVYYQWSIDEGATWVSGSQYIESEAVADFCYEGYNEATPLWVRYHVVLVPPVGDPLYGPFTDSAGNIDAYDTVSVTAHQPEITDNGSTADLLTAVANWSDVIGPVQEVGTAIEINGIYSAGSDEVGPPALFGEGGYGGYTVSPGDAVGIYAVPRYYIPDYTGSYLPVEGARTTLLETTVT